MVFSIDPYTYQLTVSGNADRDTLSQIEKLLNEGDNTKNIWTHAWICMHDADNEIVNSQANMTKANQYSLWHEVYETTGYDARNATYKMVLLLQRMVQIYLHCLRKNLKMVQGMNFILRDGCNMLKMAGRKKMIWY